MGGSAGWEAGEGQGWGEVDSHTRSFSWDGIDGRERCREPGEALQPTDGGDFSQLQPLMAVLRRRCAQSRACGHSWPRFPRIPPWGGYTNDL